MKHRPVLPLQEEPVPGVFVSRQEPRKLLPILDWRREPALIVSSCRRKAVPACNVTFLCGVERMRCNLFQREDAERVSRASVRRATHPRAYVRLCVFYVPHVSVITFCVRNYSRNCPPIFRISAVRQAGSTTVRRSQTHV